MLKNNKHSRKSKTSKQKPTSKDQSVLRFLNQNYRLVLVLLVVVVLFVGWRLSQKEDLGPLLPPPPANALYKQADQPIDVRVKDLLAYMTLEEKIGQMALVDKNSLGKTEDISKYYLGGVLSGAGAKPADNTSTGWLEMINSMKNQADNSRLGIPILYGVDANHGHSNIQGATVFPHAIGLGASRDSELVKAVAAATAQELEATGVNWNYSPSLDAPKDIRWGRVYEAFSDDPSLNATLGAAYITGTQLPAENQASKPYVLASAKHFLGTGAMNWDQSNHKKFKIDQGRTTADEQALANEYLPPYKAAVDAGVASVMVGLNEWGDGRIIDNKYLITDKLKTELGFEGFVVSDWYGVYEYADTNDFEANINAINAGLDMAMLPYDYKAFLKDVRKAVHEGKISQTRIDDAVSRILYQKFKAGLFEAEQQNESGGAFGSQTHRQLARKAAASSAVLLKNQDQLLPLPENSGTIAIAGSGADNKGRQMGAWTLEWQGVDGNWMPGGDSIVKGVIQLAAHTSTIYYDKNANFTPGVRADVGIAVVSEKPYAEGWGDNPNPSLDKEDIEAIARLRAVSDKVVVVVISGRPLLMNDVIANADAVVAAWLPGSEGAGVADVLFGSQPFTGKLPLPWPANIQQVPITYNGQTKNGTPPLFDRGFGLTTAAD